MTTKELIAQLRQTDPSGKGEVYFWQDNRCSNEVSAVVRIKGSGYRKGYAHRDEDVVLLAPVDW